MLSEIIYEYNDTQRTLCYPDGLQWERQAHIYIVIAIRNQGNWMGHFLDNLQDIYRDTNDKHVSLLVFDYNSDDIDVGLELSTRRLPPHQLLKKRGNFSRTESINGLVKLVKDPRAIIFTMDLHLELPLRLLNDIRKHCFQNRSVYAPVLIRLGCGHNPLNISGRWEIHGFGMVGMYKSDWDQIGGYHEGYKTWGGEDWHMMDGVIRKELEYERVRAQGLMHYRHPKKGMWMGENENWSNKR
ncbi:predicted protein [Nematostella vectensis]|uniref:Hexosyltransferase n=1 Tax=Nematostella vectensis TaxID=45351 RepID=A7RZF0_NEMVE|nr:predicted protein [Nematostella vectensis]|eukprot:XP_001635142.1 predicted protein [Nematostella vectensis]